MLNAMLRYRTRIILLSGSHLLRWKSQLDLNNAKKKLSALHCIEYLIF